MPRRTRLILGGLLLAAVAPFALAVIFDWTTVQLGRRTGLARGLPACVLLAQIGLSCAMLLGKRWALKWYTGVAGYVLFWTAVATLLPLAGFERPIPIVQWVAAVLMAAAAIYGWDRQREFDA